MTCHMGQHADVGRAGKATLVLGTVTIAAPSVTANTVVMLTHLPGNAPLALAWVSSITVGTGFTITSLNLTDTSTVGWFLIETGG